MIRSFLPLQSLRLVNPLSRRTVDGAPEPCRSGLDCRAWILGSEDEFIQRFGPAKQTLIDMPELGEEPYNVMVAVGNLEFLCQKLWEAPTG